MWKVVDSLNKNAAEKNLWDIVNELIEKKQESENVSLCYNPEKDEMYISEPWVEKALKI